MVNGKVEVIPEKKHELSYLAGLFNGEGYISLRPTGLQVGIQMTDFAPLQCMKKKFGGNVRLVSERGNRKEIYVLNYSGRKALIVLHGLVNYLVGKKDRTILTLKYFENWYILSKHGRIARVKQFDQEPLVKRYRKVKATGRPLGRKNKVKKECYGLMASLFDRDGIHEPAK